MEKRSLEKRGLEKKSLGKEELGEEGPRRKKSLRRKRSLGKEELGEEGPRRKRGLGDKEDLAGKKDLSKSAVAMGVRESDLPMRGHSKRTLMGKTLLGALAGREPES